MDHSRTLQWVESVVESIVDSSSAHCEPRRKRPKRTHNKGGDADFSYPYNTQEPKHGSHLSLDTPPKTELDIEMRSPKKSKGNNKGNSEIRDLLLRLETPVDIERWDVRVVSKQDDFCKIKKLLKNINDYTAKGCGVLPKEIKPYFTAIYREGEAADPAVWWFETEASPSAIRGINPLVDADAFALMELAMLRKIQARAASSKTNNRHECHWVSAVYMPLLQHVFEEEVQVENVATATMEGDSIPLLKRLRTQPRSTSDSTLDAFDTLSEFCVTVTGSSVSSINSQNSSFKGNKGTHNLAHIQSHSNAKFVNFVLTMNPPEHDALRETIRNLITGISDKGRRHVNQSAYQPIKDKIIAVSIGATTEFSTVDPLLRLGLWTAAWHKRMKTLRQHVFATYIASIHDEGERMKHRIYEQKKRMITVPVITIVGHQWNVYFVFFDAQSITMHGPVRLGSTEELLSTYVLVASLRAIYHWIQTTFKEAMEDWFMVPSPKAKLDATS
ncbi:hypothetical protein F5Y10DRAFT_270484 [Nemania abortiva]|nr:hypothetical protein F5Y10DRAFT_270484 [Nemania abortiva]